MSSLRIPRFASSLVVLALLSCGLAYGDPTRECHETISHTAPVCMLTFTQGEAPCVSPNYKVGAQAGYPTGCTKDVQKWVLSCVGATGDCVLTPPGTCPLIWQEMRQNATPSVALGSCNGSANPPCSCTVGGPIETDYGRINCPGQACPQQ